MTFESFRDALVAAMPGLILGNDEHEAAEILAQLMNLGT